MAVLRWLSNHLWYFREVVLWRRRFPDLVDDREILRNLGPWRQSLNPSRNPLEDEQPWLPIDAVRYLEQIIQPDAQIFEWGSGGSTLFFARRARYVHSVEHDPQWFLQVKEKVSRGNLSNWTGHLVEPGKQIAKLATDPGNPDAYVSSSPAYQGRDFYEYASRIEQFPDATFDLIMIDGRARPSCFKHAVRKLKPGGYLVWDNSERCHYQISQRQFGNSFRLKHIVGPVPHVRCFAQTTFGELRRAA